MLHLSIVMFGTFQVSLDNQSPLSFATEKTRALLAYLAFDRCKVHQRSMLAGLLWPDQPEGKARQNLRQTLLYLRRTLGNGDNGMAALLVADRETVQFDPECASDIDVAKFTALDQACQRHQHVVLSACQPCLDRFSQMVDLHRADFLSGLHVDGSDLFEEWAALKREGLRRQLVYALIELMAYEEQRGDLSRALHYAQRQVELEPWREEAHRALMRLLAQNGQRSAALAQYKACRQALVRELNCEPTQETSVLFEQIRTGTLQANVP